MLQVCVSEGFWVQPLRQISGFPKQPCCPYDLISLQQQLPQKVISN